MSAGPKVKICGINSADAFDAVVRAGADYLGFVFFPPSPRHVTPAQAALLSARHAGGPLRVGLFVNPAPADIAAAIAVVALDVLQIHADAVACAAIRQELSIPVWRAVGIATAADLPTASGGLDGYHIEAKAPPGATRPGGNALLLDWSVLRDWSAPGFWLLGGGLTADNVGTAIATACPPAVDVSSGVESALGVKSPDLIDKFITAARGQ